MYKDRFTGLYHTHFREYDPIHGRWLSEDPYGYQDGLNLYSFIGGDYLNKIDPKGDAGYFFGGTGNSLDPGQISNPEILYQAWNWKKNGNRHYVPGVMSGRNPDGTKQAGIFEPSWWWLMPGGGGVINTIATRGLKLGCEGARGATLGGRAEQMIKYLEKELADGDKEVNLFGFSRGSTTALEFLNIIQDRRNDLEYKDLYKGIKINFVALWDTVKSTTVNYRTELPKGMKFEHQPLHLIAFDEMRREFFDKEVLNVQGAMQIGFRGVHADDGGGYPNNAFDWISRRVVLYAAMKEGGMSFDPIELAKFPYKANWKALPTPNGKLWGPLDYHDNEPRYFPKDMYLHSSVHQFNKYSQPRNEINHYMRFKIMTTPRSTFTWDLWK